MSPSSRRASSDLSSGPALMKQSMEVISQRKTSSTPAARIQITSRRLRRPHAMITACVSSFWTHSAHHGQNCALHFYPPYLYFCLAFSPSCYPFHAPFSRSFSLAFSQPIIVSYTFDWPENALPSGHKAFGIFTYSPCRLLIFLSLNKPRVLHIFII